MPNQVHMLADHVSVNRVKNGWTVTAVYAGIGVTLVATSMEEVVGFLNGVEWLYRPSP